MLLNSQHLESTKTRWSSKIGIKMNDKWVNYSYKPTKPKKQVGQCMVETLLVHGRTTNIHKLTRFIIVHIWGGSHHLPPYSILYDQPRGLHPNVILFRDSQVGNPKILKIGTISTLEGHNFFFKPVIEVMLKEKL